MSSQGRIHQKPLTSKMTPLTKTGYCQWMRRTPRKGATTITGISCREAPIMVMVSHPSVTICTSASTCGKSGAWSASGRIQGSSVPKRAAAQTPVNKKGSGTVSGTPRLPPIIPGMPPLLMIGFLIPGADVVLSCSCFKMSILVAVPSLSLLSVHLSNCYDDALRVNWTTHSSAATCVVSWEKPRSPSTP